MTNYAASIDSIREAAKRIAPYIHHTPVMTSATLDAMAGRALFFKCELLQKVGAFKFRGACNAVMKLAPGLAQHGVVTHSSGNHAQAVALAAKLRGIAAHIVMPHNSSAVKVRAVEGYGAHVILCEPNQVAREGTAAKIAGETGGVLIPPYNHPDVIAGQGTAALELLEQIHDLDAVIAPIGGGGLMSGTCIAAHAFPPLPAGEGTGVRVHVDPFPSGEGRVRVHVDPLPSGEGRVRAAADRDTSPFGTITASHKPSPQPSPSGRGSGTTSARASWTIRVFAAEPAGADDAARSLGAGKLLPQTNPRTIADGLLTGMGDLTWPIVRDHVERVITVTDEQIIAAMRLVWERMKLLIEPSAAVPVAALLSDEFKSIEGPHRIGVILSGGNVDLDKLPW